MKPEMNSRLASHGARYSDESTSRQLVLLSDRMADWLTSIFGWNYTDLSELLHIHALYLLTRHLGYAPS